MANNTNDLQGVVQPELWSLLGACATTWLLITFSTELTTYRLTEDPAIMVGVIEAGGIRLDDDIINTPGASAHEL